MNNKTCLPHGKEYKKSTYFESYVTSSMTKAELAESLQQAKGGQPLGSLKHDSSAQD